MLRQSKKIIFRAALLAILFALVLSPSRVEAKEYIGTTITNIFETVGGYSFDTEKPKTPFSELEAGEGAGFLLLSAAVLKLLTATIGVLFVIQMIIAGFTRMTAQGSEEKITASKKKMYAAIVGFMIMLGVYIITWTVTKLLAELFGYGFLSF